MVLQNYTIKYEFLMFECSSLKYGQPVPTPRQGNGIVLLWELFNNNGNQNITKAYQRIGHLLMSLLKYV